jgi:hypothetical protein
MSEPDSAPRSPPPTIDLTAEEIGGPKVSGRATPYAIGIAVGAVAVGALVAALWIAGFGPVHEAAAPQMATAPNTKSTDSAEVSSRLDKIQQALEAPRSDDALANRIMTAEAQTKSLGETIAALTRRVDDVAAASQTALAQAAAATAAADAAKNAVQAGVGRSEIDTLTSRIAALEGTIKSLSADVAQRAASASDRTAALESAVKSLSADVAQRTSSADDRATRATIAAEALRAAVERGAGFRAELAAVKSLGGDQGATAALEPFATDGVPSAASLGRELAALLPAMQRALEPPSNDGSFIRRLENHARNLVHVTPLDGSTAPTGDDHGSAIARIGADAARGDFAAARTEIAGLPDAVRSLADGWVKTSDARDAAIAASRRIAADALAVLSKPVSQ